jgi:hypothetical protein
MGRRPFGVSMGEWTRRKADRTAAGPPGPAGRRRAVAGMAVMLLALVAPCAAVAQGHVIEAPVIIWSAPMNLSASPEVSIHPEVVADRSGYVHVLWSEDVGGRPPVGTEVLWHGDSVGYRQWDGLRWTPPVDVLHVEGDPAADFVAAAVDSSNRLHVVWMGQSAFYYSSAPTLKAASAQEWTPIVALAASNLTLYPLDIAADSQGGLYAALSSSDGVVSCMRSLDGGQTWERPVVVSGSLGALERSISNVRLLVDRADRLHATWQTDQEQGYGQAVYYARSVDGGESWSTPFQLAYRDLGDTFCEWPVLAARGADELHVIYVDGWHVGRWHRISRDAGVTWDPPQQIITSMEGINGFVTPVVDGAEQLHLIINMRTRAQSHGVYWATWLGDAWSQVRVADNVSVGAASSHYTDAAVALGNELHVVYTQNDGGEIWHVSGLISNAPRQAGLPRPAQVVPRATPQPASTGAGLPASEARQPSPLLGAAPFSHGAIGDEHAAALGVAGALLVVGSAAALHLIRSHARAR